MPAAGIVSAGAEALGGTASSILGGFAQREADLAQVSQLQQQEKSLRRKADQARKIMGFELGQFDEQAGRFLGGQEAAVAASGIEMGGSAAEQRAQSVQNLAADRANLWGQHDVQVQELESKADIIGSAAATAAKTTKFNVAQSVLGSYLGSVQGASNIYDAGSDEGWW